MRNTFGPALVAALSGLTLQVSGCGADEENQASSASAAASTGAGAAGGAGGSGTGGSGATGGQGCVPVDEICDKVDNDCNGDVDEGCACADGDTEDCYTGAAGTAGVGICTMGQHTCDATGTWGDCIGQVTPAAETCNTLDDDCDGQADNLPDIHCGVGICLVTVAACTNGQPSPCQPKLPELEVCDGIDNDCDQLIDENFPGKDTACDSGMPGPCGPGINKCVMGVQQCVSNVAPVPEVCDDVDNDCNGVLNDNLPGTGGPCSTGIPGVCGAGLITCKNGIIDCFSITSPSPEVCDSLDNDCDGQTDQGNPNGGAVCMTGLGGVCDPGTVTCTGGMLACLPNLAGMVETCNGQDDNCDGQIDENNPAGGLYCSTGLLGACEDGVTACQNGMLVCNQTTPPSSEVCDGLDNDCDGSTDEGNPGGGASCSTGMPGVCATGTMTCAGGTIICKQNLQPQPEICGNGLDDNCDGLGDPTVPVYFLESFADNMAGWTLDQEWQIGPAAASSGQTLGFPDPGTDNTPSADNGVAGVIIGGNATKSVHTAYYLTSPVVNTVGAPMVQLEFYRWLNSDYAPYMVNTVAVFNGTAWQQVWASGGVPAVTDNSWKKITHNLSAYASAAMQVRFGFSIGQISGLHTVSSWNIDDVQILGGPCQ